MKYSFSELAGMIDHSLLHPTITDTELEQGCALAAKYQVASVCVKPYHVIKAVELLRGSGVAVGTVVGFPHGGSTAEVKVHETRLACAQGATEIDMVLNIGKALSGDYEYVEQEIKAVAEETHRHRALLKIIIENDFLPTNAVKTQICQVVDRAGADFIKTSTGYGFVKKSTGDYNYRGATEQDLKLMRQTCSPRLQIKAAGGVRDLDGLIRVRDLGATRCGASATAEILEEYHRREAAERKGQKESGREPVIGSGGY